MPALGRAYFFFALDFAVDREADLAAGFFALADFLAAGLAFMLVLDLDAVAFAITFPRNRRQEQNHEQRALQASAEGLFWPTKIQEQHARCYRRCSKSFVQTESRHKMQRGAGR